MFNFIYTHEVRAGIGKYASIHGAPSANAKFTKELGVKISKSSMRARATSSQNSIWERQWPGVDST